MTTLRYLPNVVTLSLDLDKCVGCEMCTDVCPQGVLALTNGKADIIDRDACMECGACALNCPVEALTVEPGVGCAVAIIKGMLSRSEPTCDCTGGSSSCG